LNRLKWYIPFPKDAQLIQFIVDDLAAIFTNAIGSEVVPEYLDPGQQSLESIIKNSNSVNLVSTEEAAYLETYHKFIPFFALRPVMNRGVILVAKESRYENILDLREERVALSPNTNISTSNAILMFMKKNCYLNRNSNFSEIGFPWDGYDLANLFKGTIEAAIMTSCEFELLPAEIRQRLRPLAFFSLSREIICIAGDQLDVGKIEKVKSEVALWAKRNLDKLATASICYDDREVLDTALLREAVGGLGYTLKSFLANLDKIHGDLDLDQDRYRIRLAELQEKYDRLSLFNEKLIQMYREIRGSRDRLSKIIDLSMDRILLFLKDGTIIGASRSFSKYLQYTRKDIIGKSIVDIMETSLNTPLDKLIQQIDFELLRSFFVKLKKRDGNTEEMKMEFTVLELLDSKLIMGMISKKNNL